ncbi:MAG: TonB-dependent receptor plug domain-containing protein [Pedobacter sp.]|nr:TonB-dependent receptor plug domain-containing protein [Pedobacter sp.]
MKKKFLVFAAALISLIGASAFVIDDPFTELLKKLEDFVKNNPTEKVYLHLDKPYYAIGDNIWFKAYVVDGHTVPSQLSRILYVELINEKDSVKKQLKLPVQAGISWGDFKLSDSLSEGNYRIRAYTQWMRNAGPAFFFDKTIKIGNSWSNKVFTKTSNQFSTENNSQKVSSTIQFTDVEGKPFANAPVSYEIQLSNRNIGRGRGTTNENGIIVVNVLNTQPNIYKSGKIMATLSLPDKTSVVKTIPIKTTSSAIDLQFFPEGGKLVEGLPSKIAFKAIDANGLGSNVSGTITDNDGTEISKFQSTHLGMGSFVLNPIAGKSYTAKVNFADGTSKTLNLPKIEHSGHAISVNNIDTGKMTIRVMSSTDLLNNGELKLVAQHNGSVYFTAKVPTKNQLATVVVPKGDFPSGIVQITLFSANNTPVCERLAFVNNGDDKIQFDLQNLKPTYAKRGKVDISFLTTNIGKPVQGSFSISVTNASAVTPDPENESNIYTSLLLTSDLVGFVEKPNHYFLNDDVKTRSDLDLLLLTQGWRKIDWVKVAANQFPINAFQAEKNLKISGTITKGGKPVVKGKVSLFSNSGGFFATDTLSDEKGHFSFDKIEFTDSVRFVVQARTDKNNKNVQIDLDMVPNQVVTTNPNTGDIEVNVNETLKTYLRQSEDYFNELVKKGLLEKTISLKEVQIIEKKNPAPNSNNLNGSGRADAVFTEKDLETAFSLSQFLGGRVAGITVRNGMAYSMRAQGRPMRIVLDGMTMSDDFSLDDINVQDVESVEVLKSTGLTAIYGGQGSAGVLLITTKRGPSKSDIYNRYAPGIVTYAPKGYYQIRSFYAPRYDVKPDPKPDLRTTVYWNPHFISDASGKGTLNYFNTDEPGNYRVVVEGIDITGDIVHKVYTYQVN